MSEEDDKLIQKSPLLVFNERTERDDSPSFGDAMFDPTSTIVAATRRTGTGAAVHRRAVDTVYGSSSINDGEISLLVNDKKYTGWMSADVTRSLDAAASMFSVSVDKWLAAKIPMGSAIQIRVDDEPVLTGWFERISDNLTSKRQTITLQGRSRTCDFVDCTARSGVGGGLDLQQVGAVLAKPYRLQVKNEIAVLPVETAFRVQPGETAYEALERQARTRFMLITDTPSGDLLLTRAGASGQVPGENCLVVGGNVLERNVSIDFSQRFSNYTLKSQGTHEGEVRHREIGDADDPAVTRYRNLTVVGGSQMPGTKARDRAVREKQVRIGKSIQAEYTVQGWRAPDKKLWRPNMLVSVWDEDQGWLGMVLLVSDVRFSFTQDGQQTTTLGLKPRQAYEEPEKVVERRARGSGGLIRFVANMGAIPAGAAYQTVKFAASTGVGRLLGKAPAGVSWLTEEMQKDLE